MTQQQMPPSLNIDKNELAKFEASAFRWWDPAGEFKPLHDINPLRLGYIQRQGSLANQQVLDVGCGGGILSEAMAKEGAQVTGIDMGNAPLQVAKLHRLESGIDVEYLQITAEAMAQQYPAQYDIVTCMEMLEHVPNPGSVINACATLVKPGGKLFFSTINRHPKAYLFAVLGAEYFLRLLPKGTHDYEKFIKPSELGQSMRAAGLVLQNLSGMSYQPITKQFTLTRDVKVNYLAYGIKPIA